MGESTPQYSDGLREILGQALDHGTTKPTVAYEENLRYATGRFLNPQRAEELRAAYEQEAENITALRQEVADFLSTSQGLTDAEFQTQYEDLERRIDDSAERVLDFRELPWWRKTREVFPSYFSDVRQVETYRQFADQRVMQWIPRKEEIGRFLTLARSAHQVRVARGEVTTDSSLRVLDIGGANGALGVLMTDLARESGLGISYTIVDPDAEIVSQARTAYADHENLDFMVQRSDEFVQSEYEHEPEVTRLLEEKSSLIATQQKQFENLCRVYDVAFGLEQSEKLDASEIEKIAAAFNGDFGIAVPPEALESAKAFGDFLHGARRDYRSIPEQFLQQANGKVRELNQRIESLLSRQPARYDLVINSWMPMESDFTPDIRQAHGVVIVYALARDGSTGIQSNDAVLVTHSRDPMRVGDDYSYATGDHYTAGEGWVGPASSEIRGTQYHNAIATQIEKRYAEDFLKLNGNAVDVVGRYPWEPQTKTVPEPVSLAGNDDFRAPLWRLAKELEPEGDY